MPCSSIVKCLSSAIIRLLRNLTCCMNLITRYKLDAKVPRVKRRQVCPIIMLCRTCECVRVRACVFFA